MLLVVCIGIYVVCIGIYGPGDWVFRLNEAVRDTHVHC